jgi:hypothetical protein
VSVRCPSRAAAFFKPIGYRTNIDAFSGMSDDDASSVEVEMDDQAAFCFDKAFPTFQDLVSSVTAFASITHSFTPRDNGRSLSVSRLPTLWLKNLFSNTDPSKLVKYSGFLYCPQKCDSNEPCSFKVRYKLNAAGSWQVLDTSVWGHSHNVAPLAHGLQTVSGIVHLASVDDVTVDKRAAIINYLDAGLSVKMIRRKFREKFPGYEVRARVVKTLKGQYLAEKYGCDRHQINELLTMLKRDCCGPGGTCYIEHGQSLELEKLAFQIPMMRSVGKCFGKFSVIDTTHNMTMYDRQLATFNVRALFEYTQNILTLQSRLLTVLDELLSMEEFTLQLKLPSCTCKASTFLE